MKLRAIIALLSAAMLTLVFTLVSTAGPTCTADADSDGICDDVGPVNDNCLGVANGSQRDDDEDGYGNICDHDVDQDCLVGIPDVVAVFNAQPDGAPWTPKSAGAFDTDEDGLVGIPDVVDVFNNQPGLPGPTARSCADCTATPGTGVCS